MSVHSAERGTARVRRGTGARVMASGKAGVGRAAGTRPAGAGRVASGAVAARLASCLGLLAAAAALLARTAPRDLPRGWGDLGRWLAESPPETPVLALATLAAYGCIAWLAVVLVAVAAGSGATWVPPGLRRGAESLLGIALVTAAAGVVAAGGVSPRPAVAVERPGPFDRVAAPVRTVPYAAGEVVVVRGDTLWGIAERHLGPGATAAEVAVEWPRWYEANRAVVGPDPHLLLPGQRLTVPAATDGAR